MPSLTAEQETMQRYRNTFGTEHGRKVLGDILLMGHVLDNIDPNNNVQIAERNFALTIARLAGALDLVYPQLGIVVGKEQQHGG